MQVCLLMQNAVCLPRHYSNVKTAQHRSCVWRVEQITDCLRLPNVGFEMIYQSPENTGMVMVFQMLISLSKKPWWGCFAVCAATFPLTQHPVLAQQNIVWNAGAHGPSRAPTLVARKVPSQPSFVTIGTSSLVDQYRNDHRQSDLRS